MSSGESGVGPSFADFRTAGAEIRPEEAAAAGFVEIRTSGAEMISASWG